MLSIDVSPELRTARRVLADLTGYELLRDFYWEPKLRKWVLHIRLTIGVSETEFVPRSTEWRVIISPSYPADDIWFMPDANTGIKNTFPHQSYNRLIPDCEWRGGKACLDTSFGSWGRKRYSKEPTDEKSRLKWHVIRCLSWLEAAATDSLFENGDPFEFPDFPSQTPYRLVFNEDERSFDQWLSGGVKEGMMDFRPIGQNPEVYAIINFTGFPMSGESSWGKHITETKFENQTGIWVMLDKIPLLSPWQVPENFAELITVCIEQGIDLKKIVLAGYNKLQRKKKTLQVVGLGFPVPKQIGKKNELMHWFAFELPNAPKINGFRSNSETLWNQQVNALFAGTNKIKWIRSENWNKGQLTNRGNIFAPLANANILLIGAGALGSVFIELLARLGCERITIVDFDILEAGNLSRHTLTLNEVGKHKAETLCKRLNDIFPFTKIDFFSKSINDFLAETVTGLEDYHVVIDATADDGVIASLNGYLSKTTKYFLSLSVGLNANRLYCYMHSPTEKINIEEDFKLRIEKWLEQDSAENNRMEEIVEGIGCWHPLFPARIDDIQMLAGAAVKVFERYMEQGISSRLTIIEKQYEKDGIFSGLRVINE